MFLVIERLTKTFMPIFHILSIEIILSIHYINNIIFPHCIRILLLINSCCCFLRHYSLQLLWIRTSLLLLYLIFQIFGGCSTVACNTSVETSLSWFIANSGHWLLGGSLNLANCDLRVDGVLQSIGIRWLWLFAVPIKRPLGFFVLAMYLVIH